jgi:hypothetical protein
MGISLIERDCGKVAVSLKMKGLGATASGGRRIRHVFVFGDAVLCDFAKRSQGWHCVGDSVAEQSIDPRLSAAAQGWTSMRCEGDDSVGENPILGRSTWLTRGVVRRIRYPRVALPQGAGDTSRCTGEGCAIIVNLSCPSSYVICVQGGLPCDSGNRSPFSRRRSVIFEPRPEVLRIAAAYFLRANVPQSTA